MALFTDCNRGGNPAPTQDTILNPFIQKDVPYGKDSAQRMDIYLPQVRSVNTTKSIILIHGGGWNGGSKNDFASYIDSFRKRMPDYAIFNLNYRLVNGNHLFPAQEQDVKTAVDFITGNADRYVINKNGFVLLGASAGAHLALLQAYKYNEPKIQAVIDFFGPTNLTEMYNNPWHPFVNYALQMVTGTTPDQDPALFRESSPVTYITSASAPTLIFHGANDPVVDVSQSKLLEKSLKQAEVPHELVVYPGQRHGWYGSTLTDTFNRIEAFLKKNVK